MSEFIRFVSFCLQLFSLLCEWCIWANWLVVKAVVKNKVILHLCLVLIKWKFCLCHFWSFSFNRKHINVHTISARSSTSLSIFCRNFTEPNQTKANVCMYSYFFSRQDYLCFPFYFVLFDNVAYLLSYCDSPKRNNVFLFFAKIVRSFIELFDEIFTFLKYKIDEIIELIENWLWINRFYV